MADTHLLGIVLMTKREYDKIAPNQDTKYIVDDNGKILEYLGDIPVKGG